MEKINMACMVHNAYWFTAEKFAKSLDCDVDIFGSSMLYFYHHAPIDTKDYNVLVLFSPNPYSDLEEERLNNCSNILIKRGVSEVITAYLHSIPVSERIEDKTDEVILTRHTSEGNVVEHIQVNMDYDVNDLIYKAVQFYNEGKKDEKIPMKTLEVKK